MPPEILAPAGDQASLRAALSAGADAVYFGLDEGFNARDRATNFPLAELPATVARIHRAGAKAYVTLNTLVFEGELDALERVLRGIVLAGVDAIIVQDPAVALLARALCPELHVHASTQMTISSAEGLRFAAGLGCLRVVLPRELSVAEIRRLAKDAPVELEVFIHGALCVSWSGQCLTSEAWGGRSANRGQCAQSCRLPYTLVVDGQERELGEVQYLLSPQDLSGLKAVESLAEIGIASLKIEGRLKGPAYVVSAVEGYRKRLQGRGEASDLSRMALAYTRGFSSGFLEGSDHQTLVEGRFPKSRGLLVGRVAGVRGREVLVHRAERPWNGALGLAERGEGPAGERAAPLPGALETPLPPLRPGMGVVFDAGHPEDRQEPAGPLFRVEALPAAPGQESEGWILGFGDPGPDLGRVAPGNLVWLNSDPALVRQGQLAAEEEPLGRWPVELRVRGRVGEPLQVEARAGHARAEARSRSALSAAQKQGIDEALLRDKLAAFGGTPLRLGVLDCGSLDAGLHLPVSELKELRRGLVEALVRQIEAGPPRTLAPESPIPPLRAAAVLPPDPGPAELRVLCRTEAQLEAVIAAGLPEVELDWMELVGLGRAVERARAAGLRVTIATTRVQKVGEEGYDRRIERLEPDGVLVRHWGALVHFLERPGRRPALHGDFSLNVTNSLTAARLIGLGLSSLTVAHDLDATQVFALLARAAPSRFTVALHHHIATFHTEHCVYAHTLSQGRDFRSCGRPCESHSVGLRDRAGLVHPVVVDVGCRNTVFNALAQSAAAQVPELLRRGVRRFRVELVREDGPTTARVIAAYAALLAGRLSAREAVRRAGAHEQFGVTAGTMATLSG